MSNHLPECIYTPESFDPERNIVWGGKPCICRLLRACEKRVLDAAREAVGKCVIVMGVLATQQVIWRSDALNAIDALREKP